MIFLETFLCLHVFSIFTFYFLFFLRRKTFFLFIYLFIFGCVGSSFLCEGFL